mmetsp:Transcript_26705/g.61521  ORF Transcript_26705/g.61521 Transcript_26705/m.61521 type:complete len:735 (+) Transcript_26705:16-2220(+)
MSETEGMDQELPEDASGPPETTLLQETVQNEVFTAVMDPTAIGQAIRTAKERNLTTAGSDGEHDGLPKDINTTVLLPEVRKRIQQQMEIQQAGEEVMRVNVVPTTEQATRHYDDMPLLGTLSRIQAHVEAIQTELDQLDNKIQVALLPPQSVVEEAELKGTFLTELNKETGGEAAAVKTARERRDAPKKPTITSIEDVSYPGFEPGEYEPLPANMNPRSVLQGVAKAVQFERESESKAWRQVMLSKEAQDFTLDMFWWFFSDNFQVNKVDQDKMFSRMSVNFVNLFLLASNKCKDEIVSRFHDAISQAVFSIFHVVFVNSRHKFNEAFQTRLARTLAHWCSGAGIKEGTEGAHWSGQLGAVLNKLQTARAMSEDHNDTADAATIIATTGVPANIAPSSSSAPRTGGARARARHTAAKAKRVPLEQMLREDVLAAESAPSQQAGRRKTMAPHKGGEQTHSFGSGALPDSWRGDAGLSPNSNAVRVASSASSHSDDVNRGLHPSDVKSNSFVPPLRLPAQPSDEDATPAANTARRRLTQRLEKRRALTQRSHATQAKVEVDAAPQTSRSSSVTSHGSQHGQPRGVPPSANSGAQTDRRRQGTQLVKFDLVSNSPLVRHWLATYSRNDIRVPQTINLVRGGIALESDTNEHRYRDMTQDSLARSKALTDNYHKVKREHGAHVKEIRHNMVQQKRALDAQLNMMLREKTTHEFSNYLVSKNAVAITVDPKVLAEYAGR